MLVRPNCESRVYPALFAFAFAAYAYGYAFVLWNFLLLAAKEKINTWTFFVSLKQNNSEGFISAP